MSTAATVEPSKGELTRRAVLDAAIERFGRDGFRATSVTDIARDADVGPTVPYTYFSSKESLFLAALDEDAAGVIAEATSVIFSDVDDDWAAVLMGILVEAVGRHPLAERVLAGLEPHVTDRMLDIPALEELRTAVAQRLVADQATGEVRADIDAAAMSRGLVTIVLSLLMGVIQFGGAAVTTHGADVLAVLRAAIKDPSTEA